MIPHDILIPLCADKVQHAEALIVDILLHRVPDLAAAHFLKPVLMHGAVQAVKLLLINILRLNMELLHPEIMFQLLQNKW